MLKKRFLSTFLSALLLAGSLYAQGLAGFAYGDVAAPAGNEWESPQQLSLNKEQPKAWFFNFASVESARKVLPDASEYYQSLDGTWRFNWVPNPAERPADFYKTDFDDTKWDNVEVPMNWNVYGIQKDGSQKYGTPIYVNQPVIFKHQVAVGDWKKGVMREPAPHHTTYKHRNEVGSYRRTFTIPEEWEGREVYINFDGVDSFFYLWINGQYVGFSKNSRNLAAFNITKYLAKKGENLVAVEVYRNSDASFLEAQDMFRLPGIFRTVSLTATAPVQLRDIRVRTDLDANYCDGTANVEIDVRNLSKKDAKNYTVEATLYANKLFSDENEIVAGSTTSANVATTAAGATNTSKMAIAVKAPNKWSGEAPYRYTLVVQLKNKKGKVVETASTYFGFREVEIKDTPASKDEFGLAGRYFYVNGQPVKLKGVNRHESNLERGHAITREQMYNEVMLMLRGNINHVRCSHYPDAPFWYYLCDKYGIYLEDEANIESHEYYYGKESLSHVPEFEAAHIARVMEMAHATINSPSIVIWSLGNEAGPGVNFEKAYAELHKFDASRPVQYERNNNIVDMGSNQYPSIAWVRGAVKGNYNIKYPFHISEYAHSMGNAGGNLQDYWDAMESTNFFCGGAIWDWTDQAFYNYDKKGNKYMGYGGDFGDRPNDHLFCMNGVMLPDHTPKPEYYEVKKVYQNVGVKFADEAKSKIEIFNKRYFCDLSDLAVKVSLWEDGKEVSSNIIPEVKVAPRKKAVVDLGINYSRDAKKEYFVKVEFLLKENQPWAKKNYVQMAEQLLLQSPAAKPAIATVANVGGDLAMESNGDKQTTTVKGADNAFTIAFDDKKGVLYNVVYGGKEILPAGNTMKLSAFRAPVDNDNWARGAWYSNGLYNLVDSVLSKNVQTLADGTIIIQYIVFTQAPFGGKIVRNEDNTMTIVDNKAPLGENGFSFTSNRIWTIYKDGSVELKSSIVGSNSALNLARLGYEIQLPGELKYYHYYGAGPHNNYNDRRSGAFVEQFDSKVADQFVHFPKPQDMANREDVRWCALTDWNGNGVLFAATEGMSTSALQWNSVELAEAGHPYQLPKSNSTYLNLDRKVTGLGGNSCGQGGPLEHDCVRAGDNMMGFIMRPVKAGKYTETANVSSSSIEPIVVVRDRRGYVSVRSNDVAADIYYKVGEGRKAKAKKYSEPIDMSKGGTITVWDKNRPEMSSVYNYKEVSVQPIVVKYASSQEIQESADKLVDGDANTIWHTMYSVTVAQYPHWIDFDAGEECTIKGFSYLPRQDGGYNGNIKNYEISISSDGKEWKSIKKGTFENNANIKRVLFDAPVKMRYIRFTALSSHNGADFAAGAEFEIIK
ncbi:MAG: discoidin domain-containing protein [Bacteroidaceae bacterium]|nr:discoidin domain-containing protein [Bacteroidaceae bacterium]